MKDAEARKEIAAIKKEIEDLHRLRINVKEIGKELGMRNIGGAADPNPLYYSAGELERLKAQVKKLGRDLQAILSHLEIELVLEPSKVVVYDISEDEEEEEEEEESAGPESAPAKGGGRGKGKA